MRACAHARVRACNRERAVRGCACVCVCVCVYFKCVHARACVRARALGHVPARVLAVGGACGRAGASKQAEHVAILATFCDQVEYAPDWPVRC